MSLLDIEEKQWSDLGMCKGMGDTKDGIEQFFDSYENSSQVRSIVDEMCLSCPVMKQCLQFGIDNGESGVWGGIYLNNGKIDEARNAHKSDETWERTRKRIA